MKHAKLLALFVFLVVTVTSCVTPKEVNYLADLDPAQNFPLNNNFEAVVSPYDQLRITVIGMGTENMPAFYTSKSGFKVDYKVN